MTGCCRWWAKPGFSSFLWWWLSYWVDYKISRSWPPRILRTQELIAQSESGRSELQLKSINPSDDTHPFSKSWKENVHACLLTPLKIRSWAIDSWEKLSLKEQKKKKKTSYVLLLYRQDHNSLRNNNIYRKKAMGIRTPAWSLPHSFSRVSKTRWSPWCTVT
jgi:hypothetical protein